VQALARLGTCCIGRPQVGASGHVRILFFFATKEGCVAIGVVTASVCVEAAFALTLFFVAFHRDALIVLRAVATSHFIVVKSGVRPAERRCLLILHR
jgi:hypothetical protein